MRLALLAAAAAALACAPPRNGQEFRLRIALVGPLGDLTPDAEPSTSAYAQEWVFEPLLRTAPDGSAIGGLAARFHFASPSSVVVELRDGARFSDGSTVTAEDIRQSLREGALEVREQAPGFFIQSPTGAPVEPILRNVLSASRSSLFIG